jgi:hypothetical protein
MKNNNLATVALRAKGLEPGRVTPEEIEEARHVLQVRDEGVIDAIHIVGLCGSADDAALLENYLEGDQNNLYAECA